MAGPKSRKRGKIPKRRFDIALASPGVEIRLPAIPTIGVGWRLLSTLITFGLLILLYHLWTAPLYQVKAAELEGNYYLTDDAVNRVLNLYNKPVFMVDPQQMETELQRAFPGLMVNSSVQITLPATVIVTIQERQPIISWAQDGETIWVDADGISFDPAGENDSLIMVSAADPPPTPVVVVDPQEETEEELNPLEEILTPEAFMTPEMVAAIVIINDYAPHKSSLTYDSMHGLGWHDEKRNWDVYFGMDVSNIREKLIVYKAIKAQLTDDGISPVLISVEHIHAPYYRLEP